MMNGRKSGNTGGAARRRNGSNGGGGANTAPEPGDRDSERKHLTGVEMERLLTATKGARNKARDRYLLLLMFRPRLRVSEACRLKLDQVDHSRPACCISLA